MPAGPNVGLVIYRFAPPGDTWTGTHYSFQAPPASGQTVTDTYDFRTWNTGLNSAALNVFNYKDIANPIRTTRVDRIQFTFSLTALPVHARGSQANIGGLFYSDVVEADPEDWTSYATIWVLGSGKLCFYYTGSPTSTKSISAGTTYRLEAWILSDSGGGNRAYIYIDDELWVTDTTLGSLPLGAGANYIHFEAGFGSMASGYYWGPIDVTLHEESIVWTVEIPGGARWTMMAPGIA